MDAGPERPHLGAIFLARSARSATRPGGSDFRRGVLARGVGAGSVWSPAGGLGPRAVIIVAGRWSEAWARGASSVWSSWPGGGRHGGGAGARPRARAGHRRVAWVRGGRGSRGAGWADLARNAFGFLFRRLFRRIPSVTGQRVGPPSSLSLSLKSILLRERERKGGGGYEGRGLLAEYLE